MKFNQDVNILYIEDDDVDFLSLERSFKKSELKNKLFRAVDGVDALDLISGSQPKVPHPRVIFLDINMPRMNGIEFLKKIRADEELKKITVFVLTTSDQEQDILEAHNLNVAGYVTKPLESSKLLDAVNSLKMFWDHCEFPSD
jgi:CheY-like chemotaxis protein